MLPTTVQDERIPPTAPTRAPADVPSPRLVEDLTALDYYCVFCEIIAGREPGTIRYQDTEVIIIDNILRWAPVMMMAMPKKHLAQQELWPSELLHKVSSAAVSLAEDLCPNGFRLLSNYKPLFQTQEPSYLFQYSQQHLRNWQKHLLNILLPPQQNLFHF